MMSRGSFLLSAALHRRRYQRTPRHDILRVTTKGKTYELLAGDIVVFGKEWQLCPDVTFFFSRVLWKKILAESTTQHFDCDDAGRRANFRPETSSLSAKSSLKVQGLRGGCRD
eukprot:TRINITY_DN26703_c0_g1_i2.p1 TRINITY_DN26703_c0_g1~~TRINITY_DN26703_c0_g1_i2.p1  ORF type:complete len:113 (+),score=11.51 TRINITY_DN26703_c0_g1_i2:395-733(+)